VTALEGQFFRNFLAKTPQALLKRLIAELSAVPTVANVHFEMTFVGRHRTEQPSATISLNLYQIVTLDISRCLQNYSSDTRDNHIEPNIANDTI
jgi:hypothetical protein